MVKATYEGWLLETAHEPLSPGHYRAWVSDPARYVVGFGSGASEREAILAAMRAWNTARKPIERGLLAAAGLCTCGSAACAAQPGHCGAYRSV